MNKLAICLASVVLGSSLPFPSAQDVESPGEPRAPQESIHIHISEELPGNLEFSAAFHLGPGLVFPEATELYGEGQMVRPCAFSYVGTLTDGTFRASGDEFHLVDGTEVELIELDFEFQTLANDPESPRRTLVLEIKCETEEGWLYVTEREDIQVTLRVEELVPRERR